MTVTEKDVEQRLKAGVEGLGGLCLKWVSPGCTGVPDRVVILPGGRVIFAELKKPGGRLSERQKLMTRKLRDLGTDVRHLWNPGQVRGFLEEVKQDGI